jgi:hypothetical protein
MPPAIGDLIQWEHLSLAFNKVNEKKREEVNETKKNEEKDMTGIKRRKTTELWIKE